MAQNKKPKLSRQEVLQKKREAERIRYQQIKNDPVKMAQNKEKERRKYEQKKMRGTRKSITEMTPREQKMKRKEWRKYSATYYAQKKQRSNTKPTTVPISCDHNSGKRGVDATVSARIIAARKRTLKQRKKRNAEIKKKEETIRILKKKLNNCRQQINRMKRSDQQKEELNPKTRLSKMAQNSHTRRYVVEKALFGEILEEQFAENYSKLKTHGQKRFARNMLLGNVTNKNKLWKLKNDE